MILLRDNRVKRLESAITAFSAYSDEIESIVNQLPDLNINARYHLKDKIAAVLNGKTTKALQQLIPLDVRKSEGIFFTGSKLADKVASRLAPLLSKGAKVIDPACGAGNLLISCTKYLPHGANLGETLSIWSENILGSDLYHEFVRAAQIRLTLLAVHLHLMFDVPGDVLKPSRIFSGIKVCDSLKSKHLIKKADGVIINPPFGYVTASAGCWWAGGKVQAAGIFFGEILESAPEGQRIIAILPDVLRSGTRYSKWREMVANNSKSIDIEIVGVFDEKTDVDVFILDIIKGNPPANDLGVWSLHKHSKVKRKNNTIADFFKVHVGPVVPHRNPEEGKLYPYIHARNAKNWQILTDVKETRRYSGRVFKPPFVVVRRTSSPRDRFRCNGAIVNDCRNIAVENHLIALLPLDESFDSCKRLVKFLKSTAATGWLNRRIRCRHLTVSALLELPYSSENTI